MVIKSKGFEQQNCKHNLIAFEFLHFSSSRAKKGCNNRELLDGWMKAMQIDIKLLCVMPYNYNNVPL